METLLLVLRLLLVVVFAVAGVAKLLDRAGSRKALEEFGVPPRLSGAGGLLLPLAEIAVAVALLFPQSARWGALAGAALLGIFVVGIANAIRQGRAPDCHCFGQVHSEPAGPKALVRNVVLAGLAAVVVIAGPGPSITAWVQERSAYELIAFLAAAALAAGVAEWARRRSLEKARREASRPGGLPVGEPAPRFALFTARGDERKLTLDDLSRGRQPVLLVFTNASCLECAKLAPDVRRWQRTLGEQLAIVEVTEGGMVEWQDNGDGRGDEVLDHILVEENGEVTQAYGVRATPSAVAVGPDGRIATVTAAGRPSIEELVRVVLQRFAPADEQRAGPDEQRAGPILGSVPES